MPIRYFTKINIASPKWLYVIAWCEHSLLKKIMNTVFTKLRGVCWYQLIQVWSKMIIILRLYYHFHLLVTLSCLRSYWSCLQMCSRYPGWYIGLVHSWATCGMGICWVRHSFISTICLGTLGDEMIVKTTQSSAVTVRTILESHPQLIVFILTIIFWAIFA